MAAAARSRCRNRVKQVDLRQCVAVTELKTNATAALAKLNGSNRDYTRTVSTRGRQFTAHINPALMGARAG
jgi:hypothetical protein